MRKTVVFAIIVLTMSQIIMAQDIIVTNKSERIDAKILKVTESEIEYKQSNNPDGPTFTMSVSKISSILYSNGEVQSFNVKENTNSRSYRSAVCLGFYMPSADAQLYGGYLGYGGRLSFNDYLAIRDGFLTCLVVEEGEMMLDIRVPLMLEVGTNFNNIGVYACVGPQFSLGLSMGNKLFDYPSYWNRFDCGISVGGGFRFSKSISLEVIYTFGLVNRLKRDYYEGSSTLNNLTTGFVFYF